MTGLYWPVVIYFCRIQHRDLRRGITMAVFWDDGRQSLLIEALQSRVRWGSNISRHSLTNSWIEITPFGSRDFDDLGLSHRVNGRMQDTGSWSEIDCDPTVSSLIVNLVQPAPQN